ncbi:hypothetical protein PsYK624_114960 [Phanerochaete sordida]|uniref:BTB domain-containing protein n=1 Tax=Phanerochaete sordida TaxID=48140 RepID=A0A9P3GHU5_9APHY|nr:hypothetical protein PsYK624_114960 [Phanerochaete sordida]
MTTPNVLHDDKFYLADGDLAICSAASPEGATTVFRVHKAYMTYNSPVFRDILGLPAGGDDQEMHDGVPVVRVTDSAEELHAFLDALYTPGAPTVPRWRPDAPLLLTPIMRLATKYQVDALRTHIIALIEDSWPRTFTQWLRFDGELRMLKNLHAAGLRGAEAFIDAVPEPASAIRFAREFDAPAILPFAYYTLAGIAYSCKWETRHGPFDPAVDVDSQGPLRAARWELLDAVDLARIVDGRERLIDSVQSLCMLRDEGCVRGCLTPPLRRTGAQCRSEGSCEDRIPVVAEWLAKFSEVSYFGAIRPDPLGVVENMFGGQSQWGICEACDQEMVAMIREWQTSEWESLPTTFNLE